ncbi:MAG: PatB family C-S lyase [Candidatus Izimaplasma sp.]|nr:PatB family C-S lyase [Candidatus Izimaplasma bacterium]
MGKLFKTLNRKNTDSIKWELAKKHSNTDDIYTFSIADSDYETAPAIKEALKKRSEHGAFGYASIGDDYSEIICEWYKNRYQVVIKKEEVIPCPTVLNGLSVCLELFSNHTDKILIQTPVYHVFRRVIETNDRVVEENELILDNNHYRIDFKDLENKFNSGVKILVFCSPHNPVGRVWRKQELDKLINLASKYNVLIISDEIHSDIIMQHSKFISLANYFNQYNNIIIISAPTKVFNIAGLQIAQIITRNKEFSEKIKSRYEQLHLSTPNLMAITAVKTAYTKGEKWVDLQNNHIYDNYLFMKKYFAQHGNMLEVLPLEGTYLAWVKINNSKYNSTELTEELQKIGVFISDGNKFGQDKNFVRISLACSREQLINGLEKMIDFLG